MRTVLALATLLSCAATACSSFTAPADSARRHELNHYDPVMLNELALAKVRESDIGTAWILLERAARLAPHDERIARNLALLRAFRAGKLDYSPAATAAFVETAGLAGSAAGTQDAFPEPPPMWKALEIDRAATGK